MNCVGLRDVGCVALLNQIVLLRSNICVQGEEASSTKPARHLEFARISESRDLMRKKILKGKQGSKLTTRASHSAFWPDVEEKLVQEFREQCGVKAEAVLVQN